jgi:hypothetical protein
LADLLGEALASLHVAGLALADQWDLSVFLDESVYPVVDPVPCCVLQAFREKELRAEDAEVYVDAAASVRDSQLSSRIGQDISELARLIAAVAAGANTDLTAWAQGEAARDPRGLGAVLSRALAADRSPSYSSVRDFVGALKGAQVTRSASRAARQSRRRGYADSAEAQAASPLQGGLSRAAGVLGVSLRALALVALLLLVLLFVIISCVICGTCGLFAGI